MAAGLNVGSVVAKFTADITDLKQGVAQAKSEMTSLGSHVAGVGSGVASFFGKAGEQAKGLATAINVAGAAAAVGLGLMGKAALSSAADFEQTRTSFDVLLGSAEKSKQLMKDLSAFAAKTPFEFPDVANGAKRLLAFGVALDDVLPTMQNLGDIALGDNAKMDSMVRMFGKVKSKGTADLEALNIAIDAGVPIISNLAKHFGVTQEAVFEMVSKGKVKLKDFEETLGEMTKEGAMFHDGMLRQSTTMSGLYSTAIDYVGMAMRKVIGISAEGDVIAGSIFDKLRVALANTITWLDKNSDKIATFFANIITQIQGIGSSTGMQMFLAAAKAIGDWVMANKDTVLTFMQGIGFAVGGVYILTMAVGALTAAFTTLTSPLGLIILAIALLYTAWQKDWGGIREKFAMVRTELGLLKEAWKTTWENVVSVFTTTKDTVTGMFDGLKQTFLDHKTAIETVAGIITLIFLPSLVLVGTQAAITGGQFALAFTTVMIQAGIETAITAWTITTQFVASMVSAGIEAVKTSIAISVNFIKSLIDGAMYIGAFALQGWSMVASFIAQAWNAGIATIALWLHNAAVVAGTVAAGAMAAATWLLNAAIAILTSPITLVIIAIIALIAAGVWLYQNWDVVKAKAAEVGAWIAQKWSEVKEKVLKYINDLIDSALTWGAHMMENLAAGIDAGIQKVKDSVESVKNWIKDKLGFSVNKYMPSEQWGEHMLQNFAAGIEKSKALLNNQLSSVIDMNTEGLTSAGMGSQVNQTINANINSGVDLQFLSEKMRFMMRANY